MKEQIFSLLDGVFVQAAVQLIEHLRTNNINATIVGGIAVQAHILKVAYEGGIIPSADYLRKTDDLDMVVNSGITPERIQGVLASFKPLKNVLIGGKIYDITLERNGSKRPLLKIESLDAECDMKNEIIKVNFSYKPEDLYSLPARYFQTQIDEAVEIVIRHAEIEKSLRMNVISLEQLIATKIALGRNKDSKDVGHLATMIKRCKGKADNLDIKKIERMVGSSPKYDDEMHVRYKAFLSAVGRTEKKPDNSKKMKERTGV